MEKKHENLSWDDIKAMFAETDRKFAKTEKMIAETDRILTEKFAETDRKFQETDKKFQELGNHIGGISNSIGDMAEDYFYNIDDISNNIGDMAEDYFYNTFKKDKTFANQTFDKIRRYVIYDREEDAVVEYDIFLFNGTSVAIIVVKFNAKPGNMKVEKLMSRIDLFKALYPEYKNHKIYLGVAAMSFKKTTAKKLHSAGIATIHQVGKKMVVYDKEVKCFN